MEYFIESMTMICVRENWSIDKCTNGFVCGLMSPSFHNASDYYFDDGSRRFQDGDVEDLGVCDRDFLFGLIELRKRLELFRNYVVPSSP